MSGDHAGLPVATSAALEAWLAQTHDLLLATDAGGCIVWAHPRFQAVTGSDSGVALLDVLATGDAGRAALQRALALDIVRELPMRLRCADGSTMSACANAQRVDDVWLWSLEDRSARDAHALAGRFEAVAETAQIGIWTATVGSDAVEWNARMYALFDRVGRRHPPSWARWLARCVHRDDRRRVRDEVSAFLRSGDGPLHIEFRGLRRDAGTRWIEMRGALDRREGNPPRLIGVALDTTERQLAMAALRHAGERASFITGATGIGTWEIVYDGGPAHWDEQMYRLRGVEPGAGAQTRAERLALIHPDDRPRVLAAWEDETNQADFAYEFRIRRPDGSVRWLASRSALVSGANGVGRRRVGVNWDITDAKHAEETRRLRADAEHDYRAKLEFMSRMSHELRTPLNAVLGFTQLLQGEAAEAGRAADLGKLKHIRNAGEHLLALIDDVLELTGLESGQLQLELQSVALADAVGDALQRTEALAAQRHVHCSAVDLVGQVRADPARLTRVLVKLLDNAIRYNRPHGHVWVVADASADPVRLSVRDDGVGLGPEQLRQLFEPFGRDTPDVGRRDQAAIGLPVAKALVERMGGTIAATSTPEGGTEVVVTLPAADADAAVAPTARHRHGRLLYIEDNVVNVMLIEQMVATLPGLEIVSEGTGSGGIARAVELRPDLILVDMQLPDFDGYEVLRQLRNRPETAGITCIALSANALADDVERGLAAGFADYWTKPVDFKAFVAALERLFPA